MQPIISYRLDDTNSIEWVNSDWDHFALENGAKHLVNQNVLGTPIWEYIAGTETRHLYKCIFDRIRKNEIEVEFPYRCDSPNIRRYMEMRILPQPNRRLEFKNRIIKEEKGETIPLLDFTISRSHELIRMCSWCKSIETGDGWAPLEEAIAVMQLFDSTRLPEITHGMCSNCAALVGL